MLTVFIIFVIAAFFNDELGFFTVLLITLPMGAGLVFLLCLNLLSCSNRLKRALIHFCIAGGVGGTCYAYAALTTDESHSIAVASGIIVFIMFIILTFTVRLFKRITGLNLIRACDPFVDYEEVTEVVEEYNKENPS